MLQEITDFLHHHISVAYGDVVVTVLLLLLIAICSFAGYYVCKRILEFVEKIIARSETEWDDDLLNSRFLSAVSQLAPALVVKWMLPGFFAKTPDSVHILSIVTSIYILATVVYMITIFNSNLYNAFARRPRLNRLAVKGIVQMLNLITIALGIIIALSIIVGKTPIAILTALGASAAVLSLVFKDTIMGFVASIQLSVNDMVNVGDWIVVDKYGANGSVLTISLTTVKVCNWDNSISTIPPYALVSESFKNYRNMQKVGARRVERSVYIDINSVGYCSPDTLGRLSDRGWLGETTVEQASSTVNLRLFRDYLMSYLRQRPDIRKDTTLMVRQLQPTTQGLPVQLYFFSSVTKWEDFEAIQADVFDHVYASVKEFGLSLFQSPAGSDFSHMS
ncbi:MAG: mechanosensitive ion channel family protein [Duncaniella sp.]|nr:mechanosensitive ion channel family protein [Duncaniella sp.]